MGLCFTCDQPTQPQIEVNVPTTEENNQNSYKLIITQRNRKRVNTNLILLLLRSKMMTIPPAGTIRIGLTSFNVFEKKYLCQCVRVGLIKNVFKVFSVMDLYCILISENPSRQLGRAVKALAC